MRQMCQSCRMLHVTLRASSITALRPLRNTEQRKTSQSISDISDIFHTSSYNNPPNNKINENKKHHKKPNNKSQLPLMLKVSSSSTLAEAVKPAIDYTSDSARPIANICIPQFIPQFLPRGLQSTLRTSNPPPRLPAFANAVNLL